MTFVRNPWTHDGDTEVRETKGPPVGVANHLAPPRSLTLPHPGCLPIPHCFRWVGVLSHVAL